MAICAHPILSSLALAIAIVVVLVLVDAWVADVVLSDRKRVPIIVSGLERLRAGALQIGRVGAIAMRHCRWITIVQLVAFSPTHEGGKARLPGMTVRCVFPSILFLLVLFLRGAASSC